MPQIIAFIGPRGVGKSTAATILTHTCGFLPLPFAAPIKEMVAALLHYQGVPPYSIQAMLLGSRKDAPSVYLAGQSPRHVMQTLGTEWRDLIDRTLWSGIWQSRLKLIGSRNIVVDDMRFLHEAAAVRAAGGKIFTISRPGHRTCDKHISEQEWKEIEPDGVLVNDEGQQDAMFDQLSALGVVPLATLPHDVPLPLDIPMGKRH
jgi:hypothetical protein